MFHVVAGEEDYKVSFHYDQDKKGRRKVDCIIVDKDGEYWVMSSLCSTGDHFKKTVGRKIAFSRAISRFNRETRTKFWEEYFKTCKRE